MKKWIIPVIITLLTLVVAWSFLSYYLHGREQADDQQVQRLHHTAEVPVESITQKINRKNYSDHFPYRLIADNISLRDYRKQQALLNYPEISDTIADTDFQEHVFTALSDTLKSIYLQRLDFNDLSTLKSLTDEVTGLYYFAQSDDKHRIVYESLFDYWMQFINQQLEAIATKNYWNKYTFEYRYISSVCQQFNYNPSTGLSSPEKVLYNLSENRYSYLLNRFILQTTFLQKTIFFCLISMVIFCFFFTLHTLTKSKKS